MTLFRIQTMTSLDQCAAASKTILHAVAAIGWLFCIGVSRDFAQDTTGVPADTLPAQWNWSQPPLGLGNVAKHPADNPATDAKIALGRRLFFDPILSDSNTMSCASCHRPDHGFASRDAVSVGVGQAIGDRNAPTILNRGLGSVFFWDGRAESLEQQSLQPIENPKELASSVDSVLKRLRAETTYREQFRSAFSNGDSTNTDSDDPVNAANLAKALACFQRTLLVGNSAVDQFRASNYESLTESQRTGMWIFESRGRCWMCHSGDNFSDEQFHNTGVGFGRSPRDLGRFAVTRDERDRFAMKTPTLRGVAQTPPYMHDGSIASLRDVVEFYNRGGSPDDPQLDSRIRSLNLSEKEVAALTDFLQALSPSEPFAR